jgi:hypothetical protein
MQKFLTIVLLFVYLTLSVGLNIIVHTCGGDSETILAATTIEDPCGCDDGMSADKCCTTEVTTVKLNDEQKLCMTTIDEQLTSKTVAYHTPSALEPSGPADRTPIILTSYSPSPPNDLHIVNSVFRI